jgi:predicted HAD superfamily phosphohydrolase YqeG
MKYDETTVFVTGVSKPAKGDPIASTYDVFFLSAVVDLKTDAIVDVACNAASEMTRDFIRSLIVGDNLSAGVEDTVQKIRMRFFGLAQKPLIVALKDAHNRYMMIKSEKMD